MHSLFLVNPNHKSPGLVSQLMENLFDNIHQNVLVVLRNLILILDGIEKCRTPDCLPDAKGSDHMTNKNDGANLWNGFEW